MSFVRNFSDKQPHSDQDGPIESHVTRTTVQPNAQGGFTAQTVDAFVRNFSDNQSPADADAPNAAIAPEPGSLWAGDATPIKKTVEEAAQKLKPTGRSGNDIIEEQYHRLNEAVGKAMGAASQQSTKYTAKYEVREDLSLQ